ncbi:MOSC domain-containing protein [Bradyrhizobium sp. SYSU BS000235]|uniref:MOSC domain-containing protein n=1 Tax=Bradyrhizobium sp. SYSU BS000235 TaxID=3411332 RepID=UPI003C7744EE
MALSPTSPLGRLLAGPMRPGELIWIGLRPTRRAPVITASSATLTAASGIEGDRYKTQRNGGRQVTLIAAEDLTAIASFLGVGAIAPELVRRNLVTRGINLMALKERRFRIGNAVLETSGECAPCSFIEEALGPGGYNAMRGHGGITARIIESGEVSIGDAIERAA